MPLLTIVYPDREEKYETKKEVKQAAKIRVRIKRGVYKKVKVKLRVFGDIKPVEVKPVGLEPKKPLEAPLVRNERRTPNAVSPGMAVKVGLKASMGAVERIWVKVIERLSNIFIGKVVDCPLHTYSHGVQTGTLIYFHKHHILGVIVEPRIQDGLIYY